MYKRLTVLIVFLATSASLFSQEKFERVPVDRRWTDGSILKNDGTELKGLVFYDMDREVLDFKVNSDDPFESFVATDIAAFEFSDDVENRQRIFYGLENYDRVKHIRRPMFFEVLRDFKR